MSVQNVLTAILTRQEELTVLIDNLKNSLSKREQGTILRSTINGTLRFYEKRDIDSKRIYLGADKTQILKDLAQKQYEERILASAKDELLLLRDCMKTLSEFEEIHDFKAEYKRLPEVLQQLVDPNLNYEDDFVMRWRKARFSRGRVTENHIYDTLAKEKVRSKSEALIADRLFNAGIPYRYEQRLEFDSDVPGLEDMHAYYPDFTILDKRTRKIIYWEHLGKLGDPSYCRDNLTKLHDYIRHGIIQGKNLILTYESADRPLLTADVDILIRQFLL